LQTRFFILERLRQHAEPNGVPLIEAFQGDARAFRVVWTKPMGTPLEDRHTLERGEKRVQIQRKAGDHDGPVCGPTHKLYGRGIDDEFPVFVLLTVSKA
jgi:hypothetical protein